MDRRKALLVVAAVIAAVGTLLVFLYVRGADNRADERYGAVNVLRVVKDIAPGETVEAAQAAGKIETSSVSQKDLLPNALTGIEPVTGKVAVTAIYKGEQLVSTKFGATGSANGLTIPKGKIAISVNLTDPARVAGFVNPGDKVTIFHTPPEAVTRATAACCCRTSRSSVQVRRRWSPPPPQMPPVPPSPTSCPRRC